MSETVFINTGGGGDSGQNLFAEITPPEEVITQTREETLVVMGHDFPGSDHDGRGDLLKQITALMSREGYYTLRFDYFACGASDGESGQFSPRTAMRDLLAVISWARSQRSFKRLLFVMEGLSTAFALQISRDIENLRACIFLWPVFDPYIYARDYLGSDDIMDAPGLAGTITIDGQDISPSCIKAIEDMNIREAMEELSCPVMIQHAAQSDRADEAQLDIARTCLKAPRIDISVHETGDAQNLKASQRRMLEFNIREFLEKYG